MRIFILTLSLILSKHAFNQGIQFTYTNFEKAQLEAQKTGKQIFIDAYTTWCGPCKMLAKNVFTDSLVGKLFNQTFINAKIDMEGPDAFSFKEKYTINAYPTLLIINPDGSIAKKIVGAPNKESFYHWGEVTANPSLSEYKKTKVKFDQQNNDLDFLLLHLKNCDAEFENYDSVIVRIQKVIEVKNLDSSVYFDFLSSYGLPYDHKVSQHFIENYDVYYAKYTEQALQFLIFILKDGFINAYENDDHVKVESIKEKMRKALKNHPDVLEAFEQAIKETENER